MGVRNWTGGEKAGGGEGQCFFYPPLQGGTGGDSPPGRPGVDFGDFGVRGRASIGLVPLVILTNEILAELLESEFCRSW